MSQESAIDLMVKAMGGEEVKAEVNAEVETDLPKIDVEEVDTDDDSHSESKIKDRLEAKAFKLREQKRGLKSENAQLRAELEALKAQKSEPNILDYEDEAEYQSAVESYEQSKASVQPSDFVLARAQDTLKEQVEEWDEAPSDWLDVVSDGSLPFDKEMLMLLADIDNGAEVMYSLAKDKEALNNIASKLSQVKRDKALNDYIDSLSVQDKGASVNQMAGNRTQKPTVSAISPVGGGSKGKSSLESMSVADHMAAARRGKQF